MLAGFRPDVLSLHKAFDVFVMSSVTEGLGTSLLDAMACGKPVVATAAGGIPEVVVDGETGLLVPPRDHAGDGRRASSGCSTMPRCASRWARPAWRASASASASERMVQDTLRVYQRVALQPARQRRVDDGLRTTYLVARTADNPGGSPTDRAGTRRT